VEHRDFNAGLHSIVTVRYSHLVKSNVVGREAYKPYCANGVENSTQFRVRGRPLGASLSLKGAVHVPYNSAALPFQSYKGSLKRQCPEEPAFLPCIMYSIQDLMYCTIFCILLETYCFNRLSSFTSHKRIMKNFTRESINTMQ
jgi:hypothetical protein